MPSRFPEFDTPPPPPPAWRWKRLVAAVVLLAGTAVGIYIWMSGDGRRRDAALKACAHGRLAEAEPVLTDLLARHPDDVEIRKALVRAYTFEGRPSDAIPHLTWFLEADPKDKESLKLRMDQYHKLQRREEEYADARQLLALDPDDKLRKSVPALAFSIGRFDEADELCRAALRAEPKDRDQRALLAQILRARGDDDGAGQVLDALIDEDPRNFRALLARGILYNEIGRPDQAVPLLQKVYTGDPTRRRSAGYPLGVALRKIGREDEARKVLAEVSRLQDLDVFPDAMKSQPENLDLQVRLAESLLRDGARADGLNLLESVLRQNPAFAPAHLALATYYEKEGDAARAARHRKLAGR